MHEVSWSSTAQADLLSLPLREESKGNSKNIASVESREWINEGIFKHWESYVAIDNYVWKNIHKHGKYLSYIKLNDPLSVSITESKSSKYLHWAFTFWCLARTIRQSPKPWPFLEMVSWVFSMYGYYLSVALKIPTMNLNSWEAINAIQDDWLENILRTHGGQDATMLN